MLSSGFYTMEMNRFLLIKIVTHHRALQSLNPSLPIIPPKPISTAHLQPSPFPLYLHNLCLLLSIVPVTRLATRFRESTE